ncbi:MAG: hypothetical protein J6X05_07740 [Bacteroidales bacterium]|nr:hypothetical protein [Bacteroidales bacterium]
MKLAKIIIAVAALMFASCSETLEDQLMGTWTLQECEILKLDSLSKVRAEEDVASTNKALELLHHQLDSSKNADIRAQLLEDEKRLKADLESCTPQKIKEEFTELYKPQIGKMNISFKENKLIEIRVAGASAQTGAWRVMGDTVVTTFDNQPAEILIVKEITSNNVKIFSPAIDDRSVDLMMKLNKN